MLRAFYLSNFIRAHFLLPLDLFIRNKYVSLEREPSCMFPQSRALICISIRGAMSGDDAKMLPVTFQRNWNRLDIIVRCSPSEIETLLSMISISISATKGQFHFVSRRIGLYRRRWSLRFDASLPIMQLNCRIFSWLASLQRREYRLWLHRSNQSYIGED